ncbi:MAG: sodium transporter [Planctomycetia bacterium]|nr:sodium transporter [Planctomycetia bacterium]
MTELPFILTGLFFIILFVIAAWGLKKTENLNDFFLGGKTLGPWILAISYGTAYFSAVVFIGFAGKFGWLCSFKAIWVGIMNAVCGGLLAWLILGKATRRMTRRLNAMTMPEFFAARYGTNGMKIASAFIIFIFLLPYSASVFAGLTYLFQNVFGIPFWIVLTIITIVTGIYIVCGGYKAAARIDFLQGIIMFVGAILMVWFVIQYFSNEFDGFKNVCEETVKRYTMRMDESQSFPDQVIAVKPIPNIIFWSVVFMTSFAPWGLPQMVHKYYAIKDESQIARGAIITLIFAFVIGCAAYLTGCFSHLLPKSLLETALVNDGTAIDVNMLVPIMLVQTLPKWLLAIILLLVLSASMSTLCSLVLVSASAVGIDLYKGYIASNQSETHFLMIIRFLSGLFILFSYLIALFNPSWIVPLMSLSWGVVAGSFLAPYVYGLFWRKTTKLGAYAGIITGLVVTNSIYWGLFINKGSDMANAYAPLAASIAMVLPFLVVPVVSCITKPLPNEIIAKAFDETNEKNAA